MFQIDEFFDCKMRITTFGLFSEHYEVTRFRVLRWRRNTNDRFLLWTCRNFDVHKSAFEATSPQLLFKSANWTSCMRRQLPLLRNPNHWITKSLALVSSDEVKFKSLHNREFKIVKVNSNLLPTFTTVTNKIKAKACFRKLFIHQFLLGSYLNFEGSVRKQAKNFSFSLLFPLFR